jgi:hypothetical protein
MNRSLFVWRGMGFSRLPESHEIVSKLKQLEKEAHLPASVADTALLRRMRGRVASWDGIAVLAYFDEPASTWIFIALHDATMGMTAGGCRLKLYAEPLEGLNDAMRLAEAMTSKWAVMYARRGPYQQRSAFGCCKASASCWNRWEVFTRPAKTWAPAPPTWRSWLGQPVTRMAFIAGRESLYGPVTTRHWV